MATPYLTEAEYSELELPDDALSGLAAGTIDAAILWASALADSYIKKRYALPLTAWGDDLRSAVASLTTWQLLRKRGFQPGSGADESVVIGKEDAIRWLRDVSRGHAELADAADSTAGVDEAGSLSSSINSRTSFTFNVASGGACT